MKQCESCSENNPTDSNYCRKCGKSFSGEIKTFGLNFEESIDYIFILREKQRNGHIPHIINNFHRVLVHTINNLVVPKNTRNKSGRISRIQRIN